MKLLQIISFLLERLNGKIISVIVDHYDKQDADKSQIDLDSAIDGVSEISLQPIHFGDLVIPCPMCHEAADSILMGLGTMEDVEAEGDTSDLKTVGVIVYPCGEMFYSDCLTDKVAKILNAEDVGELKPHMFIGLLDCEAHGTEFPEQVE